MFPHLSVTVELELPGSPEVLCLEGVVLGGPVVTRVPWRFDFCGCHPGSLC
jgi:hypothetical protein